VKAMIFILGLVIFIVAGINVMTGTDSVLQTYRYASTTAQQAADAGASQIKANIAYNSAQANGARALRSAQAAMPVGSAVHGSCKLINSNKSVECTVTAVAIINTGLGTFHDTITQNAAATSASFS